MGGSSPDYQSEDSKSLEKTREDSNSMGKNQGTETFDVPGEKQTDGGDNKSQQLRDWRFWLTIFALFLGMFVANLDATIIGES
jgi:hypothetical protein